MRYVFRNCSILIIIRKLSRNIIKNVSLMLFLKKIVTIYYDYKKVKIHINFQGLKMYKELN